MNEQLHPSNSDLRSAVVKLIRLRPDPEKHRAIRRLWIEHSIAEDARDIPGLMATLTEDCVYTVLNTGTNWHGKPGATQFYQQLLTSFPDIHFDLQHIVIGPQGVFEEAHVTGTYEENWLDLSSAKGQEVEFDVTIFFPWDAKQKLFTGERITFSGIEEK
jgi:predicted ester cyclase